MARVGTIVHYRMDENTVRPAIVIGIHSPECVQLQVFVDGRNDQDIPAGPNSGECVTGLMWRTSVVRGDDVGQWQYHMSNGAQPEDGATEPGEPTSKLADEPGRG